MVLVMDIDLNVLRAYYVKKSKSGMIESMKIYYGFFLTHNIPIIPRTFRPFQMTYFVVFFANFLMGPVMMEKKIPIISWFIL